MVGIGYVVIFVVVALVIGFSCGVWFETSSTRREREADSRRRAQEAEQQKLRDLRLELDQAKQDICRLHREKGSHGTYASL